MIHEVQIVRRRLSLSDDLNDNRPVLHIPKNRAFGLK